MTVAPDEITRVPLDGYTSFNCPNDCPRLGAPAFHVCAFLAIPGHKCDGGKLGRPGLVTHMHEPKKGMGGNNPNAKIRLCGCWAAHDSADNGVKCDGRRYGVELRGARIRIFDRDDYKKALAWLDDPWAQGVTNDGVSVEQDGVPPQEGDEPERDGVRGDAPVAKGRRGSGSCARGGGAGRGRT